MRFTWLNRSRAAVCGAVVVVAVAATALGVLPLPKSASAAASSVSAQRAPSQLLFVDPATGLPRDPTPAELQAPQTVATPPQPIVSPTAGLTGLALSDDQMVYSVATKGPDGKIVMSEVRGPKAAARVVAESRAPVLQAGKEKRDDR